jgi:hypothetical protein
VFFLPLTTYKNEFPLLELTEILSFSYLILRSLKFKHSDKEETKNDGLIFPP